MCRVGFCRHGYVRKAELRYGAWFILALARAAYVTGQVVAVDGGLSIAT